MQSGDLLPNDVSTNLVYSSLSLSAGVKQMKMYLAYVAIAIDVTYSNCFTALWRHKLRHFDMLRNGKGGVSCRVNCSPMPCLQMNVAAQTQSVLHGINWGSFCFG